MVKNPKNNITQLIRQRNKLERKIRAYEKERDYLLDSLNKLKPPKTEDFEEILRLDLEIKRHTISFHSRDKA
jgi:hypothetical protein